MFGRKVKFMIMLFAFVLGGVIFITACDNSSVGVVDEITAEKTTLITSETLEETVEIVSESMTTTAAEYATAETVIMETTSTILESSTEPTVKKELTQEEMDLFNNMPDVVFVVSHIGAENNSNLQGFFVTKNGNVKMYSFDNTEWAKYTDAIDLYWELENVVCTSMEINGIMIRSDNSDKTVFSEAELINLYRELLLVDNNAEIIEHSNPADEVQGDYNLYGCRMNQGLSEIIYLNGWGDLYKTNTDINAQNIYSYIINKDIFPGL